MPASYSAIQTLSILSDARASSSTFVAGWESAEVNNTSDLYDDVHIEGFVTVGTTPTANTEIRIYVWGSNQSIATLTKDALDGTGSSETFGTVGIRDGIVSLIATMYVDAATSNQRYYFGAVGLAQFFGGIMPSYWGIYGSHNTGVNTNTTVGNHSMVWKGIKY